MMVKHRDSPDFAGPLFSFFCFNIAWSLNMLYRQAVGYPLDLDSLLGYIYRPESRHLQLGRISGVLVLCAMSDIGTRGNPCKAAQIEKLS